MPQSYTVSLRSYKSEAKSITKQEPALCTTAPIAGVISPIIERVTAIRFITSEMAIPVLMVLAHDLESNFKYGTLEISSFIKATSDASKAKSLPITPIATPRRQS